MAKIVPLMEVASPIYFTQKRYFTCIELYKVYLATMNIDTVTTEYLADSDRPIKLWRASKITGVLYATLLSWQRNGKIPIAESPTGLFKNWTLEGPLKAFIEQQKQWHSAEAEVERRRKSNVESKLKYRGQHDLAAEAEAIVARCLFNGTLKRLPCEDCGHGKAEAHHDDYSKPLGIRWLCRKHHLQWHRNNKAKNRSSKELEQPIEQA